MKKSILVILVQLALFTLSGCSTASLHNPQGHYSSNDDMGVFVFRSDGVFGYKFAAMFDFYDQNNLPPERGHWNLKSDGTLEIHLDDSGANKFLIEWHPNENSFDLIRLETNGTLPTKAHYERRG